MSLFKLELHHTFEFNYKFKIICYFIEGSKFEFKIYFKSKYHFMLFFMVRIHLVSQ